MDISNIKDKTVKWMGKYKYLLLVLLIGMGLMLIPSGNEKKEGIAVQEQQAVQEENMKDELEQILSNIHGAGRVQVMLTLQSGSQTIYQTDQPAADRTETVIITDADRAQNGLVQKVIRPTYRGAIVLCQGADSASVCLSVKEAVSKVTGLDSSQISVLKMK